MADPSETLSPDDIRAAFSVARYPVTSIQPTRRGYRGYVSALRAPSLLDRQVHFDGTGLQVLGWGMDCEQGLHYVEVMEALQARHPKT